MSISGYTTTYNCIWQQYPFLECITSLLGFCDEVCVADAGSEDGTIEALEKMSRAEPRIKFEVCKVDFGHPRWAIHQDGYLKAKARSMCSADYCWQTDTDEFVDARDYHKIVSIAELTLSQPVLMLPMVEFWGSFKRIRADFLTFKPRLSLNDPNITHGIPNRFKMHDNSGHPYPKPYFSDSCNYIYVDSNEDVPVCTVIPPEYSSIESAMKNIDTYREFFYRCIESLPAPLHVSWLNLERKINHYKEFWSKFHASMYNLIIEDSTANNVMFDKPWSLVTSDDISLKAEQLARIGPRSFHQKIDYSCVGATIEYNYNIPEALLDWDSNNRTPSAINSLRQTEI